MTNGTSYYYQLESVDAGGAKTRYGPITATRTSPDDAVPGCQCALTSF